MRSRTLRAVLPAVFCVLMVPPSQAQTYYRCISAHGQPEFSEQPCSGVPAERVESLNCRKARKDFEVAASAISPKRHALQARREAMHSACGMTAPQVTIINKALP
ncbi:MAG: DUF4124 domain-containing protein [Polaromonas sp.]